MIPQLSFDEHSSISRIYRDFECQHHLVQERYDERPDIPGLTPVGFARWATLLIQAHPEEEYERLQKAVLEMPISNPDDKKERFPKEISRRLFPRHGDIRIRDHIEDSISGYAAVEPRRSSQEELKSHHPHVRFDLPQSQPQNLPLLLPTRSSNTSHTSIRLLKPPSTTTILPYLPHHRVPTNANGSATIELPAMQAAATVTRLPVVAQPTISGTRTSTIRPALHQTRITP